jgi:hypothetical protein
MQDPRLRSLVRPRAAALPDAADHAKLSRSEQGMDGRQAGVQANFAGERKGLSSTPARRCDEPRESWIRNWRGEQQCIRAASEQHYNDGARA